MTDVDQTPAVITDHPFHPEPLREWDRCMHCRLAEAAHVYAIHRYVPTGPYRCPNCVETGRTTCRCRLGTGHHQDPQLTLDPPS